MKKQFSRPFDEYRKTTNRNVFNRLHKRMLEHDGKIHCDRCKYHKIENDTNKYYGEVRGWYKDEEKKYRYPNWKLVSKKKKQWMNGTYRKVVYHSNYYPDSLNFKF